MRPLRPLREPELCKDMITILADDEEQLGYSVDYMLQQTPGHYTVQAIYKYNTIRAVSNPLEVEIGDSAQ
jgi:hypothetical protein